MLYIVSLFALTYLLSAPVNLIIRAAVKFATLNLLVDFLWLSFGCLTAIMRHCHYNHAPAKMMIY